MQPLIVLCRRICPVLGLLIPLLGLLGGCGLADPWGRPPRLIVLISLDTFRADALLTRTPDNVSLTTHLDALASDGVDFSNAVVPFPHTLPSHMSLLTGIYPDVHGVKPGRERVLPDGLPTLATVLNTAGYRSAAEVTSEWLKGGFGFSRGFGHYQLLPHHRTYAERVNEAAFVHLRRFGESQEPLFLFLHYYDAHSDFQNYGNKLPYFSPAEYRLRLGVEVGEEEFCNPDGVRCGTRFLQDLPKGPISTELLAKIVSLYRAGILYLDDRLGELFTELKKLDLYDDALIIVTSDHGEEFREHGRFIHSQTYGETIKVPLIIKFPRQWKRGTTVSALVRAIDVMPTILELVKLEAPAQLQGRSLLGLLRNGEDEATAVAQDSVSTNVYSLRTGRYNLIAHLQGQKRELYDLQVDPNEKMNLAAERRDLVRKMERELRRQVRAHRSLGRELADASSQNQEVLSEAEKKRLRALGYVD